MRLFLVLILGTLIGKLYACDDFLGKSTDSFESFGLKKKYTDDDEISISDDEPEVIHLDIPRLCKWCNIEVISDPFKDLKISEEEIIDED